MSHESVMGIMQWDLGQMERKPLRDDYVPRQLVAFPANAFSTAPPTCDFCPTGDPS